MTAADFLELKELLSAMALVVVYALGYLGGYEQ